MLWQGRTCVSIDRLLVVLALLTGTGLHAQTKPAPAGQLIDRVIANVAGRIVLYSELASRTEQARQGGHMVTDQDVCGELEDLLFQQLLLEQARIDSVMPDEAQVNAELDRRISYFERQIGGRDQLEKFYGKSIAEIKADFRDQIADQLLTQQMNQKVTGDVRVTPREVEKFFKEIPQDSLPFINAGVEYARVVRYAVPTEEEVRRVRQQLDEYRQAVIDGKKDFCTVAVLYSQDKGSASRCGELGLVAPGTMVPEFDAVAMSLKDGEVSPVFKTDFGFHFMQMIERRGERYNARHVLISPSVSDRDMQRAKAYLDSMMVKVRSGELAFTKLATDYNDDEETKGSNGVVIEPNSNSARWAIGELDQGTFTVLDKLTVGDMSEPRSFDDAGGKKGYRILRLLKRTEPHRMDLVQDYHLVTQAAEGRVKQRAMDDWINEKLAGTWVRIIPDYAGCAFEHPWVKP